MSEEKKDSVADIDGEGLNSSSVDAVVGGVVEGMDIAEVLSSAGPVVKCVVLRATSSRLSGQQKDGNVRQNSTTTNNPLVLTNLIDEINIDTTPSKSMVSKVLGGPFTFLGQYEDEGIVLMIRNLPEDIIELFGEAVVKKSSSLSSSSSSETEDDGDNISSSNNNSQSTTTTTTITTTLKAKKLSELKRFCNELDIDMTGMIEKSDVVQAIVSRIPPINPHRLQPPLHEAVVCGDIVCMRVAETNEELDDDFDENEEEEEEEDEGGDDDEDEEEEENENDKGKEEEDSEHQDTAAASANVDNDYNGTSPPQPEATAVEETVTAKRKLHVPSNEEFFLNYTKEEYIKFASRTDIIENEVESSDAAENSENHEQQSKRDEGGINDDNDDCGQVEKEDSSMDQTVEDPDDDIDDPDAAADATAAAARGVYVLGGDETIDEEDKSAMFNLVMNEVLRQYREENGRGPNTQELLDLRATIAKELDVEVAHVEDADWDKKAKADSVPTGKKIGFHDEDKVLEFQPHENEHNHHHYMDLPESIMNGNHPPYDDDDDDDEEYEDESYEPPSKRYKRDPNSDDYDDEDDDNDAKKPAAKHPETETLETETRKPSPVMNVNGNGNGILKSPPPASAAASSSRE